MIEENKVVDYSKYYGCWLLVDGQNAFTRAWCMSPAVGNNGEPTGGILGFLKILQKQIRELKPQKVIVVWDGGNQKRRVINPDYKGNRKQARLNRVFELSSDEEARNKQKQWERVVEYLNHLPFIQLLEHGYECDDLIAYLSKQSSIKDQMKVILSNDKDFLQLLDKNTFVKRPNVDEVFDVSKCLEEYNIHPNNFAWAKAIAGDSSDAIEGIPGAGFKTISKRFFPIKGEEKMTLEDFLSVAQGHVNDGKKIKLYNDILNPENRQKLETNYRIIQLYETEILEETKENVETNISLFQPEYSKIDIINMMKEDQIFHDTSWNTLFEFCRRSMLP